MTKVYLIYTMGGEDPLYTTSTLEVANEVVEQLLLEDNEQLGYPLSYWIVEQPLVESLSDTEYTPKLEDLTP